MVEKLHLPATNGLATSGNSYRQYDKNVIDSCGPLSTHFRENKWETLGKKINKLTLLGQYFFKDKLLLYSKTPVVTTYTISFFETWKTQQGIVFKLSFFSLRTCQNFTEDLNIKSERIKFI